MSPRALMLLAALVAPRAFAAGEDPVQLMDQLHARVLGAKRVVIEATIAATGALTANLTGRSEWLERNRVEIAYTGDIGGKPVKLVLKTDSRAADLGNGAAQRREATAPHSNHALLVGFLRMGLLHNLARLAELKQPDHAGGGALQWVTLDGFRPTTFAQSGDLEGFMSFGFDIMLDGEIGAGARLWLDPKTELPRRRVMNVKFLQGEMMVVEDYTKFELQ